MRVAARVPECNGGYRPSGLSRRRRDHHLLPDPQRRQPAFHPRVARDAQVTRCLRTLAREFDRHWAEDYPVKHAAELTSGRHSRRARKRGVERGFLTLLGDGERLTGAYALGPEAGEWLQQATLAIRARVPLGVLRDVIQPFPTFSEIYVAALKELQI